ncbi:MAG: hypothetical protein ACOY3E_06630 [Pseudomonadota bacterium]
MITTENLPQGYAPYQSVNFCSNNIIGGGHIFAMGKVVPLLVGVGPAPRVWLQAVAAADSKEFVTVVADSVSMHPAVNVSISGSRLVVSINGKPILTAEASGKQSATVSEVDFRPIGLNIFGNSEALNLGGMRLSHNTMSGVGVAFGLGS